MSKEFPKRTLVQNRSLHKFFELLAKDLSDAGLDAKQVMKPEVDIPFTPEMVKHLLWHPIQQAMFETTSTANLSTKQVNEVYEVLIRHLGSKFGITTEFPKEEEK